MLLLLSHDTIDISKKLNESALGKLLMGIGAAILGKATYTVVRGNKPEIEALSDFVKNAKMKEELKGQVISLWKELKRKHKNSKEAAKEFKELTGIHLETD